MYHYQFLMSVIGIPPGIHKEVTWESVSPEEKPLFGDEIVSFPVPLEGDVGCRQEPLREPFSNGARSGPGCTSFASPPFSAEVILRENTVILPEQIAFLRRGLVR